MQKPKGTYDMFGKDSETYLYFNKIVESLMDKYNYKYFKTPTFELSEVFHRGVGETTDIVSKETYDFVDRGGRNITLRPEGTAGLARCLIENKLYAESLPLKAWYLGSMFRYERPQAGRNREFTQFGVEAYGIDDPSIDAEVISILVNLFKMIGLTGIKVNINSVGDKESRENYRNALVEYFKPNINDLCEDCKVRFEKNPLRMLDCKIDGESEIMKNAPIITDYLTEESKKHFELVQKYLSDMNIDFDVNPRIVRGLDYYTNTVFEVEADIKGSQNVLGAGGRYNNLIQNLGGPSVPGVGFAVGVDRLFLALKEKEIDLREEKTLDIYAFATSENEKDYLISLVNTLRLNGFDVDMDYTSRNMKNNFSRADKLDAKFIIIIGEDEIKNEYVTIKDNKTKEGFKVSLNEMIDFLDKKLEGYNEN